MSPVSVECGDWSPLFRRSGRRTPKLVPAFCLLLLVAGCATISPEQRAADARALFEHTVTAYHLPSAEATGPERKRLLADAATGYQEVIRRYRDQAYWAAQATRSLGNIRAEQGQLEEAVKLYRQIGDRYPHHDWEVLQAWKSAADLLWEAGATDRARVFDRQIVERFDTADSPAVYRTIVNAARRRL